MEAGCSETEDPLLALATPENMPHGWLRCIYFPQSDTQNDMLECKLRNEEYRHATGPGDLAVLHSPDLFQGEAKHTIRCNDEPVDVTTNLFNVLNLIKRLPFERYWISEFCLAEPLRSSPPIPLKAIDALVGRLTNNHIFLEGNLPRLSPSVVGGIPSFVRLVRLVKFDRFGTPVLGCREAQTDVKPSFHVRAPPRGHSAVAGTVFVNGLAHKVSRKILDFLRTCDCSYQTKPSGIRDGLLYGREVRQKVITPACPIHGDVEFFIPELCQELTAETETASVQTVRSWIMENAATKDVLHVGRRSAYAPLGVGEIRLLRLFPARLGRKGNMEVPMATISHKLDASRKFAALYCCWGSSTRDCLLPTLTGETLDITQHLGQILQDVVMSGTSNVWIDQICIDQDNLEEKATQVAQMLQIYKAADEVLIHLGPLPAVDKVVRFVEHVAPRWSREGHPSIDSLTSPSREDTECWFAFRNARCSPWFSRTWILQEMSVNPKTSVLLGIQRVPWDDFLAADSFSDRGLFISETPPDIVGMHSMPVFARIRARQQQRGGYDAAELLLILDLVRFLQSSDPKDKIYALMGLCDQASADKWLPFPDYTRQVADVYTSFAAAYALIGLTLALIPLAGTSQMCPEQRASMPSSLWDNRRFEHGEDRFSAGKRFQGSAALRQVPFVNRYRASGDDHDAEVAKRRIPLGEFGDRSRQRDAGLDMRDHTVLPLISSIVASDGGSRASIVVKTALFDEIIGLTRSHLFEESIQPQMQGVALQDYVDALLEYNEEALKPISAHMAASDETASRLARTMIADTWREKDDNDIVALHHLWLQRLRDTREGRVPEKEPDDGTSYSRYIGRARQTLQNRVFGVTRGQRMGIFPSTSEPGDRVGIVAGLDLPSVFSERVGGFALVGEAYVEGVMYGEFEETEAAKFEELEVV